MGQFSARCFFPEAMMGKEKAKEKPQRGSVQAEPMDAAEPTAPGLISLLGKCFLSTRITVQPTQSIQVEGTHWFSMCMQRLASRHSPFALWLFVNGSLDFDFLVEAARMFRIGPTSTLLKNKSLQQPNLSAKTRSFAARGLLAFSRAASQPKDGSVPSLTHGDGSKSSHQGPQVLAFGSIYQGYILCTYF